MKRILSIMLASFMLLSLVSCKDASEETLAKQIAPEEVSGFFEEVTLPKNESTEPSTPTDSPDLELPGEGDNLEMTQQDVLAGFSIKEKRFTYEYKDYILFDVTNETDKNYNLTVHAKYFDAEGKRLDETWEVYSDFAAGHQQYILLDPGKKFAECKYDFQLKETERDCWQKEITAKVDSINHGPHSRDTLYANIRIKNDSEKNANVQFQAILVFDFEGNIYIVAHSAGQNVESGQSNYFSCEIADVSTLDDENNIPKELQNGYVGIPVIRGIVEKQGN